jgi:hypothetical protein
MSKEKKVLTSASSSSRINDPDDELINDPDGNNGYKDANLPYEITKNKYINVNLENFKKILNDLDASEYDKDLDLIMDFFLALGESIQICQVLQPSYQLERKLFQFHYSRLEYLTKILEQFTWFNELKQVNQYFNYPIQKNHSN